MPNHDPFSQMWAHALALLDQADQMQRQFFQLRPASAHAAAHPAWEPPVDIIEGAAQVQIVVALPGVARESVHVAQSGDELIISAARALPGAPADAFIRRLEIPHGRFERRVRLPAPRVQLADSRLSDGCLYLTLHKVGA